MADEEDKQVKNNFDLYQENVKREINSLKDVCVDFAKSCQQKKNEVTAVFSKLKETEIRFSENVDGLQKELETLKAEIIVKEKNLTESRGKLSEQEKSLQCLKSMLDTSDIQCTEQKQTIDQMKEKLEGLGELASKDIRNQREITYLKEKLHQQQDDINKLKKDTQQLHNANVSWHSAYQNKDAEAKHSAKQLKDSQEARNQLEQEKKDLVSRLRKIADLTDINPNIAAFGDPNRPTKLAELFSEIYDNEWTDAYETVVGDEEKNKIQFMLKILKDVDSICENVTKRHADAITDGLTQMVVRCKVRKGPTDQTLEPDERVLKLVDKHIEIPACTNDALATGMFGNPSAVNKQIKHCKNEPPTSKRNDGEQGNVIATHDNLTTENKGTNPSQSENGNRDNQLEPNKTDDKQIDETSIEENPLTDNANINTTQSENTSLEIGNGAVVLNDSTAIKDNGRNEQKCPGKEVVFEENSEVIQFEFDELPTAQKKYIEDIRCKVQWDLAEQVTEAICNAVLKEMGPNQADEIRDYISKCSLFCLTARSHNPPVYVDFMEVTENMRFDMNVYKPYTKTGPLVDYVVWPPIYLHKGGPMLSKGVAQGKKN